MLRSWLRFALGILPHVREAVDREGSLMSTRTHASGDVRVYWNRRRKCWSIVQHGKVVERVRDLVLSRATFHVSAKGWAWSRAHKRRTVHAWVEGHRFAGHAERPGIPAGLAIRATAGHLDRVRYDYDRGVFCEASAGEPVTAAGRVFFASDGKVYTPSAAMVALAMQAMQDQAPLLGKPSGRSNPLNPVSFPAPPPYQRHIGGTPTPYSMPSTFQVVLAAKDVLPGESREVVHVMAQDGLIRGTRAAGWLLAQVYVDDRMLMMNPAYLPSLDDTPGGPAPRFSDPDAALRDAWLTLWDVARGRIPEAHYETDEEREWKAAQAAENARDAAAGDGNMRCRIVLRVGKTVRLQVTNPGTEPASGLLVFTCDAAPVEDQGRVFRLGEPPG